MTYKLRYFAIGWYAA